MTPQEIIQLIDLLQTERGYCNELHQPLADKRVHEITRQIESMFLLLAPTTSP